MAKVWWEHRHYYLEWKGRWGACVHLITETDGVLEETRLLPADDRLFVTEEEAKTCNAALVRKWISGVVEQANRRSRPVVGTEAVRRRYAEEVCHRAQVHSPAVRQAFAAVPRERYLGQGPWKTFALHHWTTADDDPWQVYYDVLIEIDPAREANNGQPSFLAFFIDALELREGEHVVHVGCGTGYYTAILAELVGSAGQVSAIEIDADLVTRARINLADLPQVKVIHADGSEHDPGPAHAIFINAGATHPRPSWLERLLPSGRLLLPLTATTPNGSTGGVLKVTRQAGGYTARFISPVTIFPCLGTRDPEAERRLRESLAHGGGEAVRSLRRDLHELDATCWLHGDDFCLSKCEVRQGGDDA